MEKHTKERIREEALMLFAQRGYLGTSMSDIAKVLGITKAALYKHYKSKQEILESILAKMEEMDEEKAKENEMPEGPLEKDEKAYENTSMDVICGFSREMFRYWTMDTFASAFRRMLTLEQYRDEEMGRLYQQYLGAGPLWYMRDIFRGMEGHEEEAEELALAFFGPMFLLFSVYDGTADKEKVLDMLERHLEAFCRKMK